MNGASENPEAARAAGGDEEADLTTEIFGLPPCTDSTPMVDLFDTLITCERWHSTLAWANYIRVENINRRATVGRPAEEDFRVFDGAANVSARLSAILRITPTAADTMLREANAIVHRIPQIGQCLRDGLISHRDFQKLVTFTDLLEHQPYAREADRDIAMELRHSGTWATRQLRDLADRIIFRHDPDAVRRREERAKRNRTCGSRPLRDGMARIGITASAEDIAHAMKAVEALADSVCANDPRSPNARLSDAAISTLQRQPFRCLCDGEDCDATTDENGDLSTQHARTVIHVICQASTLDGSDDDTPDDGGPDGGPDGGDGPHPSPADAPTDEPDGAPPDPEPRRRSSIPDPRQHPGFLDAYGLISADHVRDIARRPGTVIRPLNPDPGAALPAHQPGNPYRFSAALDTFIRARDGYCVFPGCPYPAWACDLDHVDEFNHRHPRAGGQTSKINGNAKCRFHHLVKTFGEWLDDQYIGPDGRTHTEFITPEGYRIHGRGHTTEDLFPQLRSIRFAPPEPSSPARPPSPGAAPEPLRRRTRIADKHARRRRERERNRLRREAEADPE